MNRKLFILLGILCAFAAGCATEPIAGGYGKVSVTDKDVIAAADFAIKAQSQAIRAACDRQPGELELLKILRAEQQVVAGRNYRLTLRVKDGDHQKTVETVVWWQPWRKPNPYQLTSWK